MGEVEDKPAESALIDVHRLLTNLGHEVRTPLTAILGYAEMMYDSRQTVTERLHCIGRIRQSVKVLTELMDCLQELSRAETGQAEACAVSFSLLPELGEILALLESQAWKKRLRLDVFFEGPIPETISTDARRMRQALIHIVGNAIKFTDRGGVRILVKMIAGSARQQLSFTVSDTGAGITAERQAILFQPFVLDDGLIPGTPGGPGLGLVLARRLAHVLGGDVKLVQSHPGRGSVFEFTLDPGDLTGVTWREKITQEKLSPRPTPPPVSEHRLEGMRVLLVEDALDIQILISHFLKRCGADVEIACNGYEGIKKAKSGDFDLILMDLQMPVLNGYEATAQLQREGFKIPIVALTAHAMKGVREKCLQVGCSAYLTKPINASTLLDLIAHYYERGRAAQSERRLSS